MYNDSFFLDIEPPTVTAQQKGVKIIRSGGKMRPLFYEKDEVKKAREQLRIALTPHKPKEPIEGAVELCVTWFFKTKNKKRDGTFRTTRPDTDNIQKLFKDVMTEVGFWKDDSQVCIEAVMKRWALSPGISVTVMEVEDG